jgi:hypothetical protein
MHKITFDVVLSKYPSPRSKSDFNMVVSWIEAEEM